MCTPEDIANITLHLCCSTSASTNGMEFMVGEQKSFEMTL